MPSLNNGESLVGTIESRQHQIDAWNNLTSHRESGGDRALIHMATGLGKTVVVAGDVASFSRSFQEQYQREPRVLFLAHQIELLHQAKKTFARLLPEKITANMFSHDTSYLDEDDPTITFATLQSMKNRKDQYSEEHFDYVVVDESHHAMAPRFEEVISYFKPQFRLGVTATPFRKDEKDLSQLFGKIVYSKTLAEAVSDKLLDAPNYEVVADDLLHDAIKNDFKTIRKMREAIYDKERNSAIAARIVEKQRIINNPRTIIFVQSIAHAEDFAPYIEESELLHSGMTDARQAEILSLFRRGEIPTIVAVNMLNEGVDIPEANLAVFMRATSSRTIFEQQLGRILRKLSGKSAHVLDFVGTAERLEMIYELSEEVRLLNQAKANSLGIDLDSDGYEYTQFGTFNPKFDSWDVDVIDKLRKLTESRKPAPEGWMNVGQIADILHRDTFWLYKFIRQQDIDVRLFQTPTKYTAMYLSPEDVDNLIYMHENPDGWASIADLEIILGLSSSYIASYILKNKLETKPFVVKGSSQVRTALHISPQEAMKMIDSHVANEPPKDWVSISSIALDLNVERLSIKRAINRLGVHAVKYASALNQQITWHVTNDDKSRIMEFFNPTGWTSFLQLSEELGVTAQQIKNNAIKNGIRIEQKIAKRYKNRPVDCIRDDAADAFREYYAKRAANIAPLDYVPVKDVASECNVTPGAIRARLRAMGEFSENYHPVDRATHQAYVKPEVAQKLRAYYDLRYK